MARMPHRPWRKTLLVVSGAVSVSLVALVAAADRPIAWLRAGSGALERDLNREAARGLRLAAVSDGLPACAVVAMQGPEKPAAPAEYRVVSDKDLAGALDGLVEQGFVPRASARTFVTRHEVIFERIRPPRDVGAWRLVEFEKIEDLQAALASAAAEGFRAALLVRPAFRSWPGLSERGLVLARKTADAAPLDVQVVLATRRNVDDVAKTVAAMTSGGWQFDLLFAHTRDGGPKGRRERAAVVVSKPRSGAPKTAPVSIERRASFGMLGDVVLGAVAFWDEILVASVDAERRQTWASPVRLDARDVECGPLGFAFRFDAPRDQVWAVTGLVGKPVTREGGDFDLYVLSDQDMNVR